MQLIIVLQLLFKKKKNINIYKHSYHRNNHQMFINPLMNLSLALNKLWEINIQEQLVIASFTSSEYVLPAYVNNLLNFTVRFHSWILPVDHEIYLLYNSS